MTKQEVIKEAYGENWELVKDNVDENGWIKDREFTFKDFKPMKWQTTYHDNEWYDTRRPISLKGIENNNGWIKLQGTANEITTEKDIYILNKFGEIEINLSGQFLEIGYATHYQPIIKPQPPIY